MSQVEMLKNNQDAEFQSAEAAMDALTRAESAELPSSVDIEKALPEKGIALGLHRLLARAYTQENRPEDAQHVLIQIAERLNQEGFWAPMVHLLEPLLDLDPHRVAPLLLRARVQGGTEVVDDSLLLRAHRQLPKHGTLAWEASQALDRRGDTPGAVKAARRAAPALLEDKNFELLDEVVLALLEAPGIEVTRTFSHVLDKLAGAEEWQRFDGLLGVLQERLSAEEDARALWPKLRDWWLKHPKPESMRSTVVAVLEPTLTAFPSPQAIIRTARINVPSENPSACLERLDRACRFPPGHYAEHSGWGLGLIRDNDIESVVIDFPNKPMHRMQMGTAERALDPLAPEDLRVWQEKRLEDLKSLAKEDPVELVVMALKKAKDHTASGDTLRKLLVPKPLATAGWSAWWKGAKARMESDSRIDSRRAFENIFKLADGSEAEEEIPLPSWSVRQTPIKNLAVLDTFLEQHTDSRESVLEEFQERVEHLVADPRSTPEYKAAAALWLTRLKVEGTPPAVAFVTETFDFNTLAKSDQQALADQVSDTVGLTAALGSRLQTVRQTAWERAKEQDLQAEVWQIGITLADTLPVSVLFLLQDPPHPPEENTNLLLVKGLIELLEHPPKTTHRKRALALLKIDSPVGRSLQAAPISEDAMAPVTSRLKQWGSSDKYRFPLLDFFKVVGHDHITEEVMGHRARTQAKLAGRTQGPADPYDGDLVLSAHSLQRLEAERARLGMELKTTIPKTIASARELGDLKENAEYHAAKEKQASYANRFQELETQLNRVRRLEDIERPDGVALPGTEITLEAVDAPEDLVTYWLMGEGDQDLGDHVVSYRASLGLALHGRRVGDEVELPGVHQGKHYRIRSVRERLP